MIKNELRTKLKKIKTFEDVLMRELTDDEAQYLLENGDEAFLNNVLGMTEEDFDTFEDIKRLVAIYCTEDEETFIDFVRTKDFSTAYFTLKTICNALEQLSPCKGEGCETESNKECDNEVCSKIAEFLENIYKRNMPAKKDTLDDFVEKLKKGEELELDTDTLNKLKEKLWNEFDNVYIKICNNKIKAEFE